jgi:hypothetical protein
VATEMTVVDVTKVTHKHSLGAALSYEFMTHISFLTPELIVDNSSLRGNHCWAFGN